MLRLLQLKPDLTTMKITAAHAAAIDELRNIYRSRRVLPYTASDSERDRVDAACDAASAHVDVHEALAKWEESKQVLAAASMKS